MISTGTRLGLFVGYLAFVVYGSLIPFDVRETSFDAALARFANIPWLDLGPGSRADWVANLLLYIPLVFLGSSLLGSRLHSASGRLIAVLVATTFGMAVAVAVEFAQIFFAPRTVSLNDLLAETLGSVGGGLLWLFGRQRLHDLGQAFVGGGTQSVAAAIAGYLLIYMALALFPFDFAVSGAELAAKVNSGQFGWVMASISFRGLASLVAEVIAIAPLGVLIGLLARRIDLLRVFVVGLVLGLLVESLQLLILSSVTQGLSVVARGLGLAIGVFVGDYLRQHGMVAVALWVRRLSLLLLLPYIAVLAAVTGWFTNQPVGFTDGLARFEWIQFVPFYFHYFSTEPASMASLLKNAVMYSPLGIFAWASQTPRQESIRKGIFVALLVAITAAAVFETSKLWLAGKHPDFTNLLIAAIGATVAYLVACWITRSAAVMANTNTQRSRDAPS